MVALLASAGMLATAHAFEHLLLMAPCFLCYVQRWVYWGAAAVALIGVITVWKRPFSRALFWLNLGLAALFLIGMGVAIYHSGVEWKIFAAPPTCAAGELHMENGSLLEQISKPQAIVSCADAKWRLWGLSMANWNVIGSLGLALLSFVSAFRGRVPRADDNNETGIDPLAADTLPSSVGRA